MGSPLKIEAVLRPGGAGEALVHIQPPSIVAHRSGDVKGRQ